MIVRFLYGIVLTQEEARMIQVKLEHSQRTIPHSILRSSEPLHYNRPYVALQGVRLGHRFQSSHGWTIDSDSLETGRLLAEWAENLSLHEGSFYPGGGGGNSVDIGTREDTLTCISLSDR